MGAVKEYVEKGERQAVSEVVDRSMKAAQASLKEKPVEEVSEDITAEIDKRREELKKRQEEEGEKAIQVGLVKQVCSETWMCCMRGLIATHSVHLLLAATC